MQERRKLMRRIAILLFSFILIHAPTHGALSAEKAGKLTPLRIGVPSRSATIMPFFVARERGFFRDEGFEAEIILMKAPQTVQALLGGSVEFGAAAGTAVSAAVSGVEARVVAAVVDKPTFDLISQPGITTIEQLRGKKIGVSGVGSLAEILGRRILLAHGIRPDQVTFLGLGPSHVNYLALKTGAIDATLLQIPLNFAALDDGFRKLAYTGDTSRSLQGGLATIKAIISQRPDLVTRAVRATLRAIRLIRDDRKFGVEFIKGPLLDIEGDRNRFAERVYDAMRPLFLESGAIDEELQREMIADAAQRIKPAQPVAPERVFDFSFARKVSEALR
jgi:ABC-type nitrate/sulfonate/bicarbonate transport system substrate-binding protein